MSENVIAFPGAEWGDMEGTPCDRTIEPASVASGAVEQSENLSMLVCFGYYNDGTIYAAATHPHVADVLLALDRFRNRLMASFDEDVFGDDSDAA